MTKAKAKSTRKQPAEQIAIASAIMIPLDKLDLSDDNVRQIKAGVSIDTLADDIASRGLLQSLSVRPQLDDNGEPTGRYAVQAGGRRLRALQLNVKKKRLAPDALIPCIPKLTGLATDDSLAENTFRESLHPLDQFRAFAALRAQNKSDADIAATYHVTPAVVRARLKLAAASPVLLDAYAKDEINLDVLMAFCVTGDHIRQQQVYDALVNGHEITAWQVRRMLTETSIEASDPRALFVGLETYKAAGGPIMEDLFKEDSGPWLENPDLLYKLADERLQTVRADLLAKGYKWAQISLDDNLYDLKRNLRRLDTPSALTKDDKHLYDKLSTECEELVEKREYGSEEDPFTDADRARLDEIETAIADLDNRAPRLAKKNIARSGVLISLSDSGKLCLEYGFLKPEDCKPDKDADADAPATFGSDDEDFGDDDGGYVDPDNAGAIIADKPLSDSLVRDLSSYRTVALQNALAQDFNTAFLAALHAMCCRLFPRGANDSCIELSPSRQYFRGVAGLEDSKPYKAIEARHDDWEQRLPRERHALWAALNALSMQDRADLFAHCVSLTLDAVHGNQSRGNAATHTDQLACALSLDMKTAGWTSTADNYFGRISKPQIIEAVKEAKGAHTAALIDHLKKPVMAKEAQRIIADTDWLPPLLRYPAGAAEPTQAAEPASKKPATSLPKFLAGPRSDAKPAAPANDAASSPGAAPQAAE
ncbi:ParB/RepB/Spo0J family partition protein [Hyphomicrobium sp. MC8b]|uniref:ParB/RepB/Spo0J family partition protein n=1 Tax=Hyphomicrobium sp. MC8b TaxID=300273 RepID=UPI00391CDB88